MTFFGPEKSIFWLYLARQAPQKACQGSQNRKMGIKTGSLDQKSNIYTQNVVETHRKTR